MKRWCKVLWPVGVVSLGLLVAAGIWTAKGAIAAPGATVSIEPSSQNVRSGDTFTVEVAAADVTNLAAFEFTISFDPNILSVGSVKESDFLGSTGRDVWCEGPLTEPPQVTPGNVRFGCATLNDPDIEARPRGSAVLATVTFVAIGEGVSPLTFSMLQLTNDETANCCDPITVREAAVRVVDPDDPTPPTPPPTPTRNPRAMTPTPIPGAPTPRSSPVLSDGDYRDYEDYQGPGGATSGPGGSSGGVSSSGGAAAGDGTTGSTGGSPRAGSGPPAEEAVWWPTLVAGLLAIGGATLLSLAAYVRRIAVRRRLL
jgi:hypothetical protein